jgi:hypothetical protein
MARATRGHGLHRYPNWHPYRKSTVIPFLAPQNVGTGRVAFMQRLRWRRPICRAAQRSRLGVPTADLEAIALRGAARNQGQGDRLAASPPEGLAAASSVPAFGRKPTRSASNGKILRVGSRDHRWQASATEALRIGELLESAGY